MAAKRKRKKNKTESIFTNLKQETKNGILSVVFFVFGALLIVASLGKAGVVGNWFFSFFTKLLGVGYYLLPTALFLAAVAFLRPLSNELKKTKIISVLVFFISGLSLIGVFNAEKSGIIGTAIAGQLLKLFDYWGSVMLLSALMIISVILLFEPKLTLESLMFWKRLQKDEYTDEEEEEDEEYEEDEEEYEDDEEEEEKPKKSLKLGAFVRKNKKETPQEELDLLPSTAPSMKEYIPPSLTLLGRDRGKPGVGDIKANANLIKRTLENFGIDVVMDEISIGPTVTRYSLKPAEGVRLSKIVGLQNNLELALAAHPVRIEAPIPGKSLVGIEVPNTSKTTVGLAGLLSSDEYQKSPNPLMVSLGKGISGKSYFANLAKMPHVLIAGATGSGKSVTIHTVINSLLFRNSPDQLKFIMVDPKRVELTLYNGIPHLLTPVITNAKKAILALKWAAKEMDRRYDILEQHSVRDIQSYHKNILGPALKKLDGSEDLSDIKMPDKMPYIAIVVDELADIMQSYPRELESAIVRLAQMSRAVGIHLVISTQRPSVNVITGLIKANIPARIALQVASQIDSRTILDAIGAEKLLGAGDMLYLSGEMSKPERIQSAFMAEKEVKAVVSYLKKEYEDELTEEVDISDEVVKSSVFDIDLSNDSVEEDNDDLYEEAKDTVIRAGKASTSYLQRKLRIGYARAARIMDMLEDNGVIGEADGSKPREILDQGEEEEEESEEEY